MKKIFLFILLFFISINSSFALNESQKADLVKQADKIYLNFEKKISKLDNKKQLETISNIVGKISPYSIYRDKVSEKNKILLNNLYFLFNNKKYSLEQKQNTISNLQNKYYWLLNNWIDKSDKEIEEIKKEIIKIWWLIDEKEEQKWVEIGKKNKKINQLKNEFYSLKEKWEFVLAKEKQDEIIKSWGYLNSSLDVITDETIIIENLKKEYYSYRANKQWDLMRQKENELVKYKIYFWDKGEILPLDDSKPLVYTERWSVWWVDTKAQQAYDQAKVDAIKSSKLEMQLYSNLSWLNLITVSKERSWNIIWAYNTLSKWMQKWFNDEIITREYINGNGANSAHLRELEKIYWNLSWKTTYELDAILYNQYLWYFKDWKLLDEKEFEKANSTTKSSFSDIKNSTFISASYLHLWYYLDSKWNILFDSSFVSPELQALKYIDLK